MSGTFNVMAPDMLKGKDVNLTGEFTNVPYVVQTDGSGNKHIANVDGVPLKGKISPHMENAFWVEIKQKSLYVQFPDSETPVTYDIESLTGTDGIKFIEGLYSYKATSGSINITSHNVANRHIEGTFSVEVESIPLGGKTKQITDGTFSYTYY